MCHSHSHDIIPIPIISLKAIPIPMRTSTPEDQHTERPVTRTSHGPRHNTRESVVWSYRHICQMNGAKPCRVLNVRVASLNSTRRRTASAFLSERLRRVRTDLSVLSAWWLHSVLTAVVNTSCWRFRCSSPAAGNEHHNKRLWSILRQWPHYTVGLTCNSL